MTKIWIILGVLLVLGGGAGAAIYYRQQHKPHAADPADAEVTTIAAVVRGDIVQSVQSPGTVASKLDVPIKCRAYGEVIALPFDISDTVHKGDLLVQLDKVDEVTACEQSQSAVDQAKSKLKEAQEVEQQAELDLATATEQAQANIVSAQITADNLQRKAERQKTLMDQKLASPEDYETAETAAVQAQNSLQLAQIAKEQLKSQAVALDEKKEDVKLAEEQVKLDNIDLVNANQQLQYTTVTSPIDGVVSDLQIEMGTFIASALSNVSGGQTVMTLSDLSQIYVLATVDESAIGDVAKGQKADITVDAYPGKHFEGDIVRIATTGVNTTNVVTFEVKIEVTSKNKLLLKPLMTANITIIEDTRQNAVLAPLLSVVQKHKQNFVGVIKPDGSVEERTVTIGIHDSDNDEITSGLAEGERVVVHRNEATSRWMGGAGGMRAMMGGGGR